MHRSVSDKKTRTLINNYKLNILLAEWLDLHMYPPYKPQFGAKMLQTVDAFKDESVNSWFSFIATKCSDWREEKSDQYLVGPGSDGWCVVVGGVHHHLQDFLFLVKTVLNGVGCMLRINQRINPPAPWWSSVMDVKLTLHCALVYVCPFYSKEDENSFWRY